MATTSSAATEESSTELLEEVKAHYGRAIQALNQLIDRIEEGQLGSERETARTITEARRAMQTIFDERKKIEDQLRRDAGVVHGHAIDFDSARVEIRRRLDRIRPSDDAG